MTESTFYHLSPYFPIFTSKQKDNAFNSNLLVVPDEEFWLTSGTGRATGGPGGGGDANTPPLGLKKAFVGVPGFD